MFLSFTVNFYFRWFNFSLLLYFVYVYDMLHVFFVSVVYSFVLNKLLSSSV